MFCINLSDKGICWNTFIQLVDDFVINESKHLQCFLQHKLNKIENILQKYLNWRIIQLPAYDTKIHGLRTAKQTKLKEKSKAKQILAELKLRIYKFHELKTLEKHLKLRLSFQCKVYN